MPGSSILPIRNAIYSALNDDAAITAIADVYQVPPDNISYPYIDIEAASESIDDTFAGGESNGRDCTIQVNCWTEERYDDQMNVLLDLVIDNLNWKELTLTGGWTFISCNLETANTFITKDYRHAATRFRIRCYQ